QKALARCRRCKNMVPPVVTGQPVVSPVMLVGQAPGVKEGIMGRPFAWTAGKTLFKWFASIGLQEDAFRQRVYMAAVCRCFPGKNPRGGDRVPSDQEIDNCSGWLDAEIALLRPRLIIPVGKLAIEQFMEVGRLVDVIGHEFELEENGDMIDVIPLPHPSGASTWHRTEPGISLLQQSLALIEHHPAWRAIL
ncbi:MAG: uracil-DNA glycosylase family protein, partial [Oceanisphaera sp.]|nr:uracil-DNA glycosylase family protein [Oceanisphaera sp.]